VGCWGGAVKRWNRGGKLTLGGLTLILNAFSASHLPMTISEALFRLIREGLLWACLGIGAANHSLEAGFSVEGKHLLDANGNPFVMRGVNHPHAWYPQSTDHALKFIAATGANTVRVVLSNGERWERTGREEVAAIIARCKDLQMITVLEVHDATGYREQEGSVPLSTAVDYWISMRDVLMGEEAFVIINIANEPLGNGWPEDVWAEVHSQAIGRLRDAGITHTLMVDMANWGQDWRGTSLRDAPQVASSDPLENIIFSVHMYDIYAAPEKVDTYLEAFARHELPLVIGEFAADHGPGKEVAVKTIMERAEQDGLGYLGWSWSGNGGNLGSLDIVENFDPERLTPWGRLLVEGTHGLAETAKPATVFRESVH